MPGAGKGEAVRICSQEGIPWVRMGDLVWEETQRRGLPLNDENVGAVASEMRETEGGDVWARRTIDRIERITDDTVAIDGVRNWEEVETFQRTFPRFTLVAIHASARTRCERILGRGRSDDPASLDRFHHRDEREMGWGIGKAIERADVAIENEGSLEELEEKVKRIIDWERK